MTGNEMYNDRDGSRLDRIELALKGLRDGHVWFQREHKQLLITQGRLIDRLDRYTKDSAEHRKRTDGRFAELAKAFRALRRAIENLLRKCRPQA